jgi:hypothetical protein
MPHRLLPIAATVAAFAVAAPPAGAITNGVPDGEGHPNVGAILVELPTEFGSGLAELCTGSC